MVGYVGGLDWGDCEYCVHYRKEKGGCDPLDEIGTDILEICFDDEMIICLYHKTIGEGEDEAKAD